MDGVLPSIYKRLGILNSPCSYVDVSVHVSDVKVIIPLPYDSFRILLQRA